MRKLDIVSMVKVDDKLSADVMDMLLRFWGEGELKEFDCARVYLYEGGGHAIVWVGDNLYFLDINSLERVERGFGDKELTIKCKSRIGVLISAMIHDYLVDDKMEMSIIKQEGHIASISKLSGEGVIGFKDKCKDMFLNTVYA